MTVCLHTPIFAWENFDGC